MAATKCWYLESVMPNRTSMCLVREETLPKMTGLMIGYQHQWLAYRQRTACLFLDDLFMDDINGHHQ